MDQEGMAEFRQLRSEIDPAVESDLFVQATLDPEAGIKEIKKNANQEHGKKFSSREIGDYLFEMESNAEFIDVELDAVAIQTLFETGEIEGIIMVRAAKRKHTMSHWRPWDETNAQVVVWQSNQVTNKSHLFKKLSLQTPHYHKLLLYK